MNRGAITAFIFYAEGAIGFLLTAIIWHSINPTMGGMTDYYIAATNDWGVYVYPLLFG